MKNSRQFVNSQTIGTVLLNGVKGTLIFGELIEARVRTRGGNAWLRSARISRHSQGAFGLSNHTCLKRQLRTLLLNPTPYEAMDSVINDRRSIKWPCYAVNSSRNGLHPHPKKELWHEVKLEKYLEQPNIDSFFESWYSDTETCTFSSVPSSKSLFKLTKAFSPFSEPSIQSLKLLFTV